MSVVDSPRRHLFHDCTSLRVGDRLADERAEQGGGGERVWNGDRSGGLEAEETGRGEEGAGDKGSGWQGREEMQSGGEKVEGERRCGYGWARVPDAVCSAPPLLLCFYQPESILEAYHICTGEKRSSVFLDLPTASNEEGTTVMESTPLICAFGTQVVVAQRGTITVLSAPHMEGEEAEQHARCEQVGDQASPLPSTLSSRPALSSAFHFPPTAHQSTLVRPFLLLPPTTSPLTHTLPPPSSLPPLSLLPPLLSSQPAARPRLLRPSRSLHSPASLAVLTAFLFTNILDPHLCSPAFPSPPSSKSLPVLLAPRSLI